MRLTKESPSSSALVCNTLRPSRYSREATQARSKGNSHPPLPHNWDSEPDDLRAGTGVPSSPQAHIAWEGHICKIYSDVLLVNWKVLPPVAHETQTLNMVLIYTIVFPPPLPPLYIYKCVCVALKKSVLYHWWVCKLLSSLLLEFKEATQQIAP